MKHPLPRSARKRIEIVKSAAAAFRRKGYHGAGVDHIATALNMTKGNLYYYFKNKEEILYVCHDYSLDLSLARLREVERSTESPDKKLHAVIAGFVRMMIDEMHGSPLTLDLEPLSPHHLRTVIAKRDRFDRGIRRILREGMETGLFRESDPKLVTFAILGAINWIPRWFDPRGTAGSADIAGVFADYLVGGLLAAPSDQRTHRHSRDGHDIIHRAHG